MAGKIASAESGNKAAKLAEEAYSAAKKSVEAECAKRGNKCRELEKKADDTRAALMTAKPVQSADPGSERLAAVLGIDEAKVQLYVPLLLPLGLEFGGFIFLAFGLAPVSRREDTAKPQIAAEPVASEIVRPATAMQTIARAAAMPAKAGTKIYYLQRLEREHPAFSARIASGEMSVYAASIAAGLRKAPAKTQWTKAEAYA